MKARNTLVIWAALACGVVQAASVSDDFNRADTVAGTDAAASIGPGWMHAGDPAAAGQISSNSVLVTDIGSSLNYLLLNAQVKTLNDGAMTEFTFSGDVQIDHGSGGGWAGVVFNYQDANNHYIFRYNGLGAVQVLRRNNGFLAVINAGGESLAGYVSGRPYTITVHSRESYVFEISVVDTVTATEVYATTNSADVIVTSEDGFGGFYAGPGGGRFDNFSLVNTERSPTAIYDTFARPDTTLTNDASVSVGPHWQDGTGNPDAQYRIYRKEVLIGLKAGGSSSGAFMIVNDELGTLNDGTGTNFTMVGTLKSFTSGGTGFSGLVFNYQDPSNYYEMRYDGLGNIQFLRVVAGAGNLFNAAISFPHVEGRAYEFTVTSSEPYQFYISVRDTVTDTIVHSSGPHIDSLGNFKDGIGGMYTSGGHGHFMDYYLDSTGAPAPASGYTVWAAGWGTPIGTDQDDPDNDGLPNVYEYGLGGDPTNGLDRGTAPEFGIVGGQFEYIHPQVADPDSGIAYHLELTDNLTIGSWVNAGYTVDGTNDTGLALDRVTNTTSTVESEKFIKLVIELQ